VRFRFIHRHRERWPLWILCKVMQVKRSGYHSFVRREENRREKARIDEQLSQKCRKIWSDSNKTYGLRRIQGDLRNEGTLIGKSRLRHILKAHGITGMQRKSYRCLTDRHPRHARAQDWVNREFSPQSPNQIWASDITYVPTAEGFLYLAVVLDLFGRRVVGWCIHDRQDKSIVLNALKMARRNRKIDWAGFELVHHSDLGCQYTSETFRRALLEAGIRSSMGRRGCCYDNAVVESFFGTLKHECVHGRRFQTREEAKKVLFSWMEGFYNNRRLHSTLGYLSLVAFENQWERSQFREECEFLAA
jgi:putative transposase